MVVMRIEYVFSKKYVIVEKNVNILKIVVLLLNFWLRKVQIVVLMIFRNYFGRFRKELRIQ